MTRAEAKMIAEELAKLMDVNNEELLTKHELAEMLGVSSRFIDYHRDEFPSVKIGTNIRYPKNRIMRKFMV